MSTLLMMASTALETISAIKEGQTLSATEKYNAMVAEAQAGAVRTSATFESEALKRQSEFEQAQISRTKLQAISTQQARYAKAGVRTAEGTPLEVMADTAAQFELDLAANRYNLGLGLEKIRYGSEVSQAQLRTEAQYRRILAKSYRTASYLKAGSTLLTGVTNIMQKTGSDAAKIAAAGG